MRGPKGVETKEKKKKKKKHVFSKTHSPPNREKKKRPKNMDRKKTSQVSVYFQPNGLACGLQTHTIRPYKKSGKGLNT